ncbi:hypothetical protein I3W98_19570 [Streptomyces cavourensis]|nr:hypothetical protein [Streptomyces cavourensis]
MASRPDVVTGGSTSDRDSGPESDVTGGFISTVGSRPDVVAGEPVSVGRSELVVTTVGREPGNSSGPVVVPVASFGREFAPGPSMAPGCVVVPDPAAFTAGDSASS